jgi:hypothetical protein
LADVYGNIVLGEVAGASGDLSVGPGATLSVHGFYDPEAPNGFGGTGRSFGGEIVVGQGGQGSMDQYDGTVTADVLRLGGAQVVGDIFSGAGTYFLNGGTATFQQTAAGNFGQGNIQQTGGTLNAGWLSLGAAGLYATSDGGDPPAYTYYSDGKYEMTGGALNAYGIWVSQFGLGTFTQSGEGALVHTDYDLIVGSAPALIESLSGTARQGWYTLNDGRLEVLGKLVVGAGNGVGEDPGFEGEPGALGTFTQTGGNVEIGPADGEPSPRLILGQSGNVAGGTGNYALSGGNLLVRGDVQVGGSGLPDGLVDGTGTFLHTGGQHTVEGALNVGVGQGVGRYELGGESLLSTGITYLGQNGSFEQTLGQHDTGYLNVYGGLYDLRGGDINVAGNMGVGHALGSAEFRQTGGSVRVNDPEFGLYVGGEGDTTGTYGLEGGTLDVAANVRIGTNGTGSFTQSGGTHTVGIAIDGLTVEPGTLILGEQAGSSGRYDLTGGVLDLNSGDLIVGNSGAGEFFQDNSTGQSTVGAGTVTIGANGGGTGTYKMEDTGADRGLGLFAENLVVGRDGVGTFNLIGGYVNVWGATKISIFNFTDPAGTIDQSGGTFETGSLLIANACTWTPESTACVPGSYGRYNLSGGDLQVHGDGQIGRGGYAEFNQSGGQSSFGTLFVGNGASVPGHAPATQGIVNLSGGGLGVDGNAIVGAGDPDYVEINTGHGYAPNGGLGGIFHAGGDFTVRGNLILGEDGETVAGRGSYQLGPVPVVAAAVGPASAVATPTLNVWGTTVVGQGGEATFTQTGGIHTLGHQVGETYVAGALVIGEGAGSLGTYNLQDGVLATDGFTLGGEGTGWFNHSGGTLIVNGDFTFHLGGGATGEGHYVLNGEDALLQMNGNEVKIGVHGKGYFEQSAGTHDFAGAMYLGDRVTLEEGTGKLLSRSYGEYRLSGGTLTGGGLALGEWGGEGRFIQTGGSFTVGGITLARQNLPVESLGHYELRGGELTVNEDVNVGAQGLGEFLQSGGSLSAAGMAVGSGSTLSLSGGSFALADGEGLLLNRGLVTVSGGSTRVIDAQVQNDGTFEVNNSTVEFTGNFLNNGAYLSDPSVNRFTDLTISASGYLQGGAGDLFQISGSFVNESAQSALWNTGLSTLELVAATGTYTHNPLAGSASRFSWGELILGVGTSLSLGSDLYLGVLGLAGGLDQLPSIVNSGAHNIYYDATLAANAYLGGQNYALAHGAWLIAQPVPIPGAVWLFGSAAGFLAWIGRRNRG